MNKKDIPRLGEIVEIPWGAKHHVRATIREIHGRRDDLRAVVILSPEVSGTVVSEPTTSSWPLRMIRRLASTES